MCRTVHDDIDFSVGPKMVFKAYLDSRTHARFTGMPARMSAKVGGHFTAAGDYIEGYNLDLVPGKRIVQAWRGSDWPKGAWSVITLQLTSKGKGAHLVFDQRGIPEKVTNGATKEAWEQYYWAPMRTFFSNPKNSK